MARLLAEAGYKVVALSDSKSAIYEPDGLDIERVKSAKDKFNVLKSEYADGASYELKEHQVISHAELLTLDVDLLVPAALENAITKDNVHDIKANWIVEISNGPITPDADKILFKKGVVIIPDVLANAGGVIVSYFEWVQNRAGFPWTMDEVRERMRQKLKASFEEMWVYQHTNKNTSLRQAAYTKALRHIEKVVEICGTKEYYSNSEV